MSEKKSFLFPSKTLFIIVMALVFLLGLGIRLYDLFDYPLDFHATRQMHSVLITRGMYYESLEDAPEWQRSAAISRWHAEPYVEPQMLERLTAFTWRLAGEELLWIPRLFSIIFWMVGALFLFFLVNRAVGRDASFISTLFFLILPYAGIASRSFQPDPLMVTMIIASLWAMYRWYEKQTWGNAVLAGLLGGLAILVKSVAVFYVAGGWALLALFSVGFVKALKNLQVWLIAFLCVLPYAIYHVYGVYIAGFLGGQFSFRFFPQLWLDPVFYLRWNGMIASVLRFEWLITALVGSWVIKDKTLRTIWAGLWVGYILNGLALSYHMYTHDYYQLPLIPIVAVGVGAAFSAVMKSMQGRKTLVRLFVFAIVLAATVLQAWDIRVSLSRDDYEAEITFWQKLGEKIGHDSEVAALSQDAGARLFYWGWVDADMWMLSGDVNLRELAGQEVDFESSFQTLIEGKDLFVVTMLDELARQPKLESMLSDYTLIEATDDYLIYDLNQPVE